MSIRKLHVLLLLLGSLPQARAQAVAADAPSRWLVGAQVGLYPKIITQFHSDEVVRPWPVQVLARYQGSRSGAEAGLLLRASPSQVDRFTDQYGTTTTHTSSRAWLLTLVRRYQLAPQRPARWRLDAEAGFMIISSRSDYTSTYENARTGQQSITGSGSVAYNDLPLLGGLGFTYQLAPHLALTADARAGWSFIGTLLVQALTQNSSFVAPLWPVCGVGASYTLGPPRGR